MLQPSLPFVAVKVRCSAAGPLIFRRKVVRPENTPTISAVQPLTQSLLATQVIRGRGSLLNQNHSRFTTNHTKWTGFV